MNPTPPPPPPSPQPQPRRPKVVVPSVTRRDVLVGILVAIPVLGFILFAVLSTGGYKERNKLTGIIRAKNAPGDRETLMIVSKKGVTEKTADTGYSLKVWVESEKRERDVMVSKEDWEKAKVGDDLTFLVSPREQR